MTGTPSPAEWTEQVGQRVKGRIDRVTNLEEAAAAAPEHDRMDIGGNHHDSASAACCVMEREVYSVPDRQSVGNLVRQMIAPALPRNRGTRDELLRRIVRIE